MSSMNPMEVIIPENIEPFGDEDLAEKVANSTDSYDDDEETESADYEEEEADDEDTVVEEDEEDEDEETEEDADDEEVRETISSLQSEADGAAALLAKSNINYSALVAEYKESGRLSKTSIASLEAAGISENLIEGFINGQQARLDIYAERVKDIAGGEAEYAKLMKWASRNLTDKEIAHFDKAVESYDIDEARFAVNALKARRETAVGVKPELIKGRSPKIAGATKGFSSMEEMAKAMDDPRYETDEAYTRKIEARMLASNF